jgi:hypothetical protein
VQAPGAVSRRRDGSSQQFSNGTTASTIATKISKARSRHAPYLGDVGACGRCPSQVSAGVLGQNNIFITLATSATQRGRCTATRPSSSPVSSRVKVTPDERVENERARFRRLRCGIRPAQALCLHKRATKAMARGI